MSPAISCIIVIFPALSVLVSLYRFNTLTCNETKHIRWQIQTKEYNTAPHVTVATTPILHDTGHPRMSRTPPRCQTFKKYRMEPGHCARSQRPVNRRPGNVVSVQLQDTWILPSGRLRRPHPRSPKSIGSPEQPRKLVRLGSHGFQSTWRTHRAKTRSTSRQWSRPERNLKQILTIPPLYWSE